MKKAGTESLKSAKRGVRCQGAVEKDDHGFAGGNVKEIHYIEKASANYGLRFFASANA